MIYKTSNGVEFHVVPETAICTNTGKHPDNMIECPLVTGMRDFSDFMCFPETCQYYTERRTDETK